MPRVSETIVTREVALPERGYIGVDIHHNGDGCHPRAWLRVYPHDDLYQVSVVVGGPNALQSLAAAIDGALTELADIQREHARVRVEFNLADAA